MVIFWNENPTPYDQIVCIFIGLILILLSSCSTAFESEAQATPPNIVLIISDDQAWSDYSFLGHEQIETPRLDQLARTSLTFTRGYVAAPLCSPSLATIITGLYPHQHGITGNDPTFEWKERKHQQPWLEERQRLFRPAINQFNQLPLLTKQLKERNYLSMQTGKWWMGSWEDGHFTHGMTHGDPSRGGRHGDEGLTIGRQGLAPIYQFIEEADSLNQPFFVWYAPFLPHAPHTPPAGLEEKYLAKAPSPAIAKYWAMCEWFDQTCGDLLDYLDEHQLSDNTLIVYVCDNGWIQDPSRQNGYAPRSKRTPYEGGLRTPMMFKWPGKIAPHMDTTTLVSAIDIVPTILAACGLDIAENLPGTNVLDPDKLNRRQTLFAEAFDHDIADLNAPNRSLQYRIGINYPWKLLLPDTSNLPDAPVELFNIATDPTEQFNVLDQHLGVKKRLEDEINDWWIPKHLGGK